jgi:tetratricopeptide (TPR) repeat protein
MDKIRNKLGGTAGPIDPVKDARSERRGTGTVLREPRGAGAAAAAIRASETDWDPGQELLDDFVVERVLGEGGMGKVYLLRSRSTGSQFAVKRAKGLQEADRRDFLAELQTWIDLPEHSNLVPCRFFRTVGDEVLIFAEYVEGGSLEEWIHSRKLYEGGTEQALERMLDITIQFAWGLHCLHELGLVHQDVKPGNMLMGGDGKTVLQGVKPRVTDYGLARARAAARGGAGSGDVLVSTGGGTPAYWSPEQAAGWKLTQKTDIWSWGLSVLEMFAGGVTWTSGLTATATREEQRRQRGDGRGIAAMQEKLADLLRECFREEPAERLANLAEAMSRLKTIYLESIGREYGRTLGTIERAASVGASVTERRGQFGATWTDPRVWLERALRAAGRDPGEAEGLLARTGATRRGTLVGELAAYDEAKRIYLSLVWEGRRELEDDLTCLCVEKAFIHETAADRHGAIGEYNQAIAIYERLVNQEGHRELANGLARVYENKAVALCALGDNRGAVALFDQAIAIRERLVNQEGRRELADDLARLYQNKGTVVGAVGDHQGAAALYDQATAIWERLVNQDGRTELADDLANVYMNKANALRVLGDKRGAVALFDQAIAIRERLVNQEGRRDLANGLATAYMNKAIAVSALGDKHGAVTFHNKAITILERLVNQEGRRELANDLARVYQNKAAALATLGDKRGAMALLDQTITIWERLVNQEGRRELAGDLAWLTACRGSALVGHGRRERGLRDSRSAQGVLEAEVARTGRADLKEFLVQVRQLLRQHST